MFFNRSISNWISSSLDLDLRTYILCTSSHVHYQTALFVCHITFWVHFLSLPPPLDHLILVRERIPVCVPAYVTSLYAFQFYTLLKSRSLIEPEKCIHGTLFTFSVAPNSSETYSSCIRNDSSFMVRLFFLGIVLPCLG